MLNNCTQENKNFSIKKKSLKPTYQKNLNFEKESPGIMSRSNVTQSLLTGYTVLDSLVPIGRGQRQLIIGNKGTGKTTLSLNIILNQKRVNRFFSPEGKGRDRLFCVYVAIGMRQQKVKQLYSTLLLNGSMWYTSIINGSASTPYSMQYLAPFSGCTLAEFYRDNGMNSLIIYDDLKSHANTYRQLCLLMRNPPGREAYPGDTFYLHSRLLERAAQMSRKYGYGSLTALPIVEILQNNLSTFIPTNLISITDGQWFLRDDYAKQGLFPALDLEKSVSRIGRKSQSELMKWVSVDFKNSLIQYLRLSELLQAGVPLSEDQEMQFNKSKIAVGIWDQSKPRFYEENILLMLISNMKLLCFKKPKIGLNLLLQKIYKNNAYLFTLILESKHSQNTNFVQKLLVSQILYIINNIT